MNLIDRLLKKIVRCPNCGQRLRVPIRYGKRLRVTCKRCATNFDLSFVTKINPLLLKLIITSILFFFFLGLISFFGSNNSEKVQEVVSDEIII